MIADSKLQNRAAVGDYCHSGPALMSARQVSHAVGATYHTLLQRIAAGALRPDAQTVAGGFLFREDRLDEIEAAFE